ncbi:hypothetical protein NDU88_002428 [Pleurodeles waltl]|uniref:Uncharacterized protein n=1 Tax=Pleurodeles waltl TaxID=8319 RepID=A0AAV7NGD2_PLEWA|nr:hypothetical protein NDU88_002428 [Pleurodeles waltl]
MPRGKATGKATGKPARQLLFYEALCQQKHPSAEDPPPLPCANMADDMQGTTMDRILQEISAVGHKLEGMDNAMVALTVETRSMRLDIAGQDVDHQKWGITELLQPEGPESISRKSARPNPIHRNDCPDPPVHTGAGRAPVDRRGEATAIRSGGTRRALSRRPPIR